MEVYRYDLELTDRRLPVMVLEETAVYGGHDDEVVLDSPEAVRDFMCAVYRLDRKAEETVYVIAEDNQMHPFATFLMGVGSDSGCPVSMRALWKRLLVCGASRFTVVHNHPSGITEPSGIDKLVTQRIEEGARLLDLRFDDHVIIARGGGFYSFAEAEAKAEE